MGDTIPLPGDTGVEILRTEVGSTLHGTGLDGGEDRDEMGIYVEWPRTTIGLFPMSGHWSWRTQPEGKRSGPGDTDLIVYSLRKWARLALAGNPSVLLPLFAPEFHPTDHRRLVVYERALGTELRANAHWFASRRAGIAFLGYMERQRQRMTGERGRAGRIRVTPDGELDTKYAMHALRLGYQGIEFLSTGRITLPIPDDPGEHLRAVRRGEVPVADVIAECSRLEDRMRALLDGGSPLPANPDVDRVEAFVIRAHRRVWAASIHG